MAFCMPFCVVCPQWTFYVIAQPSVLLIEIPSDMNHNCVVAEFPQTLSPVTLSLVSSRNEGLLSFDPVIHQLYF